MREHVIEVDGRKVFLREEGEGSPVVLLHGFPQTGACWGRVASHLAVSSRVIVPDLPGFGRSERPRAFDAGTVARTLVGAVHALGIERATYAGHDWGGSITFRIAADHAPRVTGIVVVNAPYRKIDLRRAWHMLAFNLPVLPEAVMTATGGRWIDLALRAGAARSDAFSPDALAEYRAAYASLERKRAALAYYRTVTRQNIVRGLGRRSGSRSRIDVPTLIVWGEQDPVLPVALADGIAAEIDGARVERVPGAGHFVPEEAPERLAELIAASMRR